MLDPERPTMSAAAATGPFNAISRRAPEAKAGAG
jgi:hypothetical protein